MSTSSALTTPVSVASTSSADAAGGSVIDVSSLVSQLVAATETPQQTLIANQTASVTANISAVGTLQSALSTFQSALTPLSTPTDFDALTANSSDPTAFTATADSSAVSGSYAVTITNLATAQQLESQAFAGGSNATVGTGTLSVAVGSSSFAVTIDGSDDTVAGIASAINSASGNTSVSATVVNGTGGAYLLLTSNETGAANTISVTETDGGGGLAAVTYGTGNTGNYTQAAAAADANYSIAGVAATSATNSVPDAVEGVTLDLVGTTAGATLTVANDTSTVEGNIQGFVSAYNTLQAALASLGSFDATTDTAGPMLGNPVLTGIENEISQTLDSMVGTSSYNSLPSVGIMTQSDGSLALDTSTLAAALSTNFSAVSALFSGTNGIAAQLNSQVTSYLATNGPLTDYETTLTGQENALTTQSNNLNTQMEALTTSLTQQYSALNALLSSLQTTSSYLTQAFASLPTVQGVPNA
ncbi:MAG: flagellar filament capping protein FliD [Steroidobacteraceae bacterium]